MSRPAALSAEPLEDRLAPAAGTLDPTFGSAGIVRFPNGRVGQVASLPDGRTLAFVAGEIERFLPDGSPDNTFGTAGLATIPGNLDAIDFTALPDGGVLIGGATGNLSVGEQIAVIHLTAAGAFDTTFGNGGGAVVGPIVTSGSRVSLLAEPDGTILVAGGQSRSTTLSGLPITTGEMLVSRLTATGQPDATFGSGGTAVVPFPVGQFSSAEADGVAVQPDGRIVVGGKAVVSGQAVSSAWMTVTAPVVVRLTAAGQLDPTFGSGGRVTVTFPQSAGSADGFQGVRVLDDGRVVLSTGGVSTTAGVVAAATRLTAAGQLDPTYGSGGLAVSAPYLLGTTASSSVFVANTTVDALGRAVFATANLYTRGNFFVSDSVFRLTADGVADPQFGTAGLIDLNAIPSLSSPDFLNTTHGLAVQADGNILLGGTDASGGVLVRLTGISPPTGFVPAGAGTVMAGGAADGTFQVLAPSGGVYATAGTVAAVPGSAAAVRVATGDVNGDGVPDYVVGSGPDTRPEVVVIDGRSGAVLADFLAFESTFTGGVFVAAADLTGNGKAEVVVTPDQGGGPRVVVYAVATGGAATQAASFFGIDDPNFRGGARPALGDVNHDGRPDLAVAAGFLGGPRVAVFDGRTLFGGAPTRLVNDFYAFPGADAANLFNGTFVALGDVDGDGFADLIFGGGPGGAPRVFVLSGAVVSAGNVAGSQAAPLANFFVAGNATDRGGVRVAATNADGDGKADLVTGSGEGRPGEVRVYPGRAFPSGGEPASVQDLSAFGGTVLPGGVFVG